MNSTTVNSESEIENLLPPSGKVSMILDTDASCEVDDQFALTYALLSRDKIDLEACYAAPYVTNGRDPGEGMEKSYGEINHIIDLFGVDYSLPVFKGASKPLSCLTKVTESDATRDLINRAKQERQGPLYVVCIAGITNIASALLLDPSIKNDIVVVWLGGNPDYWDTAREFNLIQDMEASKFIFDCGVPLVHIPCKNVAEHLWVSLPEIERYVKGRGSIGDYLYDIFEDYYPDHLGWSKSIWDIANIAYLINPDWVPTTLRTSPILTDKQKWDFDERRHLIRVATDVRRNDIFYDFYTKLHDHSQKNIENISSTELII